MDQTGPNSEKCLPLTSEFLVSRHVPPVFSAFVLITISAQMNHLQKTFSRHVTVPSPVMQEV